MLTCRAHCECRNETSSHGYYYRTQCGLTDVPPDIPSTVTELYLHSNNISTIQPNAFSHLTSCTLLSLSHNHLTKISKQMFSGLTSVKHLFLEGNQIFYIQPGSFSSLPNLSDVRLANNDLTLFPFDVFCVNESACQHPSELALTLVGNPLVCNWRLAWVKQAAQEGWLTLYNNLNTNTLVECTNFPNTNWKAVTLRNMEKGMENRVYLKIGDSNFKRSLHTAVNSNTVNSKFHLIRSYCEIFFYNFPNILCLKYTVNSNFHLIRSKTLPTNDFELTVPDL